MVAASTASGSACSQGVKNSAVTSKKPAVNTFTSGERAPASACTTVREKLAPTAKPPLMPAIKLAPPMARISALVSMRSRRLAAMLWAIDTCSTKVSTAISTAGSSSACQVPKPTPSTVPKVKGGKPDGTAPTTATPWPAQPSWALSAMNSTITSRGEALAVTSAAPAGTPSARSPGLNQRLPSHRPSAAPTPTAKVSGCMSPRCCQRLITNTPTLALASGVPSTCGSWLMAISRPDAVTKPDNTGWLKKPATKPMRSAPISSSSAPTISAKVKVVATKSACPSGTTAPTAATDMMDRSAAGPGASTVLLPISAYTTSGNTLAYRPVTAGMPASKA